MSKALVAFAESAGRYRDALRAALPEEPTPEMIEAMASAANDARRQPHPDPPTDYMRKLVLAAYRALRAELLGGAG